VKVLKFGGSSVATGESIEAVLSILEKAAKNDQLAVVVSALGGVTDLLQQGGIQAAEGDPDYRQTFDELCSRHLDTARSLGLDDQSLRELNSRLSVVGQLLNGIYLLQECSDRTQDKLMSRGELLSSFIVARALKQRYQDCMWKDSRELIVTDSNYTAANLQIDSTKEQIKHFFHTHSERVVVFPGFIARSMEGTTTTLGRGGSDFTAAIIAASVGADLLEIWTDVSGMYSAHPQWVRQAFPIAELSYREAMELSHFGAKVLYPPTVQPALQKNVPILIKNTFAPEEPGTLITSKVNNSRGIIKGISHLPNIALLTLEGHGMVGVPGFSKRLFETLSVAKINVIMITQASSEHSICVGLKEADSDEASQLINAEFAYEISLGKIDPIQVETDLSIVAVIGDNIKGHQGVSGKMFSSLGQNNVNIRAIAQGASERNISAVIETRDVKKAINTLHNSFFEKQVKVLNLYIKGVGNVGARLIEQIRGQRQHLKDSLLLDLRICGLSNTRKMVFAEYGIDLENWKDELDAGEDQSFDGWLDRIGELNLRNSVFLDVTASSEVAQSYAHYLRKSIAVVACNKIACSGDYEQYQELKELTREYQAPFLFETNVGAGLPVINTLNNLVNSGDRIRSIQAVLSGSLNFVFNHYDGQRSFKSVVEQATDEGYTEPDPRIDLSGIDVMRKILILIRESGEQMEIEHITNHSFLPDGAMETSDVDTFLQLLGEEESHFKSLCENAGRKGCKLKFVAEYDQGKASVGLKEVAPDHPFYNLEGKDNIVLFYTDRYAEQPLIIKGAGAGAEVTASGLFGDVISLAKN
jgi:aspartokinase/homoserine dehydrogenase 1